MSDGNGSVVSVKIVPNDSGNPKGKLADAEVIFGAECGPFQGLRLIGFGIWERRDGGRNVTFSARQFEVNGNRRSFVLLRSVAGDESAYDGIRQTILDAAWRAHRGIVESRGRRVMNDEELGGVWTTFQPTTRQRQRIDARVFAWIEARDTPLAAEWLRLFKVAPFSAAGLVAVSVVAIATAPPLVWLATALL